MTTPNNAAAAMDRLEQKWREEAAAEWTHCQNKELSEWVRDRCYGQHNRLLSCADELAAALQNLAETVAEICPTLDADVQSEAREVLAAYDALTSQPSGEVLGYVSQSSVDALDKCRRDDHNGTVDLWMRPTEFATIPVYTHPSALAPKPGAVGGEDGEGVPDFRKAYARAADLMETSATQPAKACAGGGVMHPSDFKRALMESNWFNSLNRCTCEKDQSITCIVHPIASAFRVAFSQAWPKGSHAMTLITAWPVREAARLSSSAKDGIDPQDAYEAPMTCPECDGTGGSHD